MKVYNKNIWRIIPMLLLSIAMVSCSEDEDAISSFFELSSVDLECNSNEVVDVVVPIEGQTYKLTVKCSVDVTWTTKCEGGNWLVATPVTKQSGNGEISIVASGNPTNIKNRAATVTIKNSVNDEVYKYAFTQLYDPNQLVQKEEAYTYFYYEEDSYNEQDPTYTTYVNKVDGQVNVTALGQDALDKYNEENLTDYKLFPDGCYNLGLVTFTGEASAPLEIKIVKDEAKKLNPNEKYMLPISISVGDKQTEIIWLLVDIRLREISRPVKDFNFYNANQDITVPLTLYNEGSEVTFSPFTEEELAAYNNANDKEYVLIPTGLVSIPSSVEFDELDVSKDVNILFDKGVGALDENKEYVYAVHVNVDGLPFSEVFMKPRITTPVVTMETDGYEHILIDKDDKEASHDFRLYLYDAAKQEEITNQWEFTVEFEDDESTLEEAVAEYNKEKGTNYTLLPKANRSLSSSKFTSEDKDKTITATLLREGLELGKNYLYPIIPTNCGENIPFKLQKQTIYVLVVVDEKANSIDDLEEITLTPDMLKASGTNGGDKVDNILKLDGSYWESIWSPGSHRDGPKIDPVYGVYIDIDFSKKLLSQAFSFNYIPRSYNNAVPNEIVVYAGTSSSDLKKIGELKFDENELPFAKNTWIGRVAEEDKSKLPFLKLKESGVSLVRLSFTSSRNKATDNSVKDILGFDFSKWTSGDYPCVALQYLKVYGK